MINEENLRVVVMGGEEVKTPVCILLIGQRYKAYKEKQADAHLHSVLVKLHLQSRQQEPLTNDQTT